MVYLSQQKWAIIFCLVNYFLKIFLELEHTLELRSSWTDVIDEQAFPQYKLQCQLPLQQQRNI